MKSLRYVPYSKNQVEFDAYDAKTRDEKVPSAAKAKKGGAVYNNFDTDASVMYTYQPDAAVDVPAIVKASGAQAECSTATSSGSLMMPRRCLL